MDNTKYYYQSNGEVHGPVTNQQLKTLLETGIIDMDTMAVKEGDQQWIELVSILNQFPPSKQKVAKKYHWVAYLAISLQIVIITCLLYDIYITKSSLSLIKETAAFHWKSNQSLIKANKTKDKSEAINEYLYNFAVQQINENHDEAIYALDERNRDAHIKLDYQAELLQMGNDKIKRLTQDQFLLGGISASKKREEIEKLEQQDKEDKLVIKKRRAEENCKTSIAKEKVAEERSRRLLELRRKTGKSEK